MAKVPDLRPRAMPASTGLTQTAPAIQKSVGEQMARNTKPGPFASLPGIVGKTPPLDPKFGTDRNVRSG